MSQLLVVLDGMVVNQAGEALFGPGETGSIYTESHVRSLDDFAFSYVFGGAIACLGPPERVGSHSPGSDLLRVFGDAVREFTPAVQNRASDLLDSESERQELALDLQSLDVAFHLDSAIWHDWMRREAVINLGDHESLRDPGCDAESVVFRKDYVRRADLEGLIPVHFVRELASTVVRAVPAAGISGLKAEAFVRRNALHLLTISRWSDTAVGLDATRLPHATRGLVRSIRGSSRLEAGEQTKRVRKVLEAGDQSERVRKVWVDRVLRQVLKQSESARVTCERLTELRHTKQYDEVRSLYRQLARQRLEASGAAILVRELEQRLFSNSASWGRVELHSSTGLPGGSEVIDLYRTTIPRPDIAREHDKRSYWNERQATLHLLRARDAASPMVIFGDAHIEEIHIHDTKGQERGDSRRHGQLRCDFLLVAALPKEFQPAARGVFKAKRVPKSKQDTRNYYECTIRTVHGGQYGVRLVCVGRKGAARTVAAVTEAVKRWRPRHVVMFGIAAVVPGGGRKKGHLLVSEWIMDYPETKKSRKDEPRLHQWHCQRELVDHLSDVFYGRLGGSVHLGDIISQPNLSKNAKYRDSLVRHTERSTNRRGSVVGLEMEGGGLATAIDELPQSLRPGFLLMKGAVDWGNYHKDDGIQQKTALAVARFVQEFLASEPVATLPVREKPSRPAQRPICKLQPGTSTVRLGENKYKENGRFEMWAVFHLLVGGADLEWVSFWAGYYAQGCHCEPVEGKLSIDGQATKAVLGEVSFQRPLKLQANTTYEVRYSARLGPPLMQQTPSGCEADSGDLVIEGQFRVKGEDDFRPMRWTFRFTSAGEIEPVSEVRQPPRLGDEELRRWSRKGVLSDAQYERLQTLRPSQRYLAALTRSEHTMVTAGLSDDTLKLLRELYKAGYPEVAE